MEDLSKLSELARRLQSNISTIEQHLSSKSCSEDQPNGPPPVALELPPPQSYAREQILDDMDQLRALLLGPFPYLMRLMSPAVNIFSSLQAISRFKIAQSLAPGETVSYDQLAQRCGMTASDLRRFLRLAIANHIFSEPRENMVQHNATSMLLVKVPRLQDFMGLVVEEMWPASAHSIDAMCKWQNSTGTAHTGFCVSKQDSTPFFEALGSDPARASRFASGMTLVRSAPPFNLNYLLDNLGWDEKTCPRRVVEIGGSQGSVAHAMLAKFPLIEEYVTQDLVEVVDGVKPPEELRDRLQFEAYDFFTEQRRRDADVYIFRFTLHNWPDEEVVKILKNQLVAFKPGAMLILNEICLPPPGKLTGYQEQFLRGFDLSMKHINNGKERDLEEWTTLIALVSEKLKIESITSPPGSLLSIIRVSFGMEGNSTANMCHRNCAEA